MTSRQVVKRDGRKEDIDFNKIIKRIKDLSHGLSKHVIPDEVAQKVIKGIVDGIKTHQLDELATEITADMAGLVPDYAILSGRIAASNLRKITPNEFSEAMDKLYNFYAIKDKHTPMVSKEVYELAQKHKKELNAMIDFERDDSFTIHAIQTLKKSYLLKCGSKIIENPQYMWLRVSLGIHGDDLENVKKMYDAMSTFKYIHSSPTLFNSGTPTPQMASCFLIDTVDDSIEGIYDTLKECALISKRAGGVGVNIHKIRSNGAYICGTNGTSSGIVKMLKVFDDTFDYVNQGGKRKGSCAVYLSPDHPDFMDFMKIREPGGVEEMRARGLFTAVWIPDLFMWRVKNGEMWSFFDPNTAPGLEDVYDEEFGQPGSYTKLYEQYEKEGLAVRQIPAVDVWYAILESQTKTGTPYLTSKDQGNRMSNQKNIGVIKSSNLCSEIFEVSSNDRTSVCNLSSLNLSSFVDENKKKVDYDGIIEMAGFATENLNKVIDRSYYPTEKCRYANENDRPLGIGVSGFQDMFFKLQIAFDSDQAKVVNKRVFEAMYYGAVKKSVSLAKRDGYYNSFPGSPASQGIFNFDMYGVKPDPYLGLDWETLRKDMINYGLRNSLLIALMPTASSATIMNVKECFEAQTSNIYTRNVLSGEFIVSNRYLAKDLDEIGMWNKSTVNQIITDDGSVHNLQTDNEEYKERLEEIKKIYKIVWEHKMKTVIDMAADRQAFVDQSQSMNLHLSDPDYGSLSSMYFYAWEKGLKTLCYYLRMHAKSDAIKFTVDDEDDVCVSCQS